MKKHKYFTLEEMTRSDTANKLGIKNNIPDNYMDNIDKLMDMLDLIRVEYKAAIIVTSGYRNSQLNKAVGGSNTSQHLTASAADIKPKYGNIRRLWDIIVKLIKDGKITVGQLIWEYGTKEAPKWIHISLEGKSKNQILYIGI